MSLLNLMRVILAAINDGKDTKTVLTFHGGTGSPESFRSFDQLTCYARATVGIDTAIDTAIEDLVPDLLCSIFTDDCAARGKRNPKFIVPGGGLANLPDFFFPERRRPATSSPARWTTRWRSG